MLFRSGVDDKIGAGSLGGDNHWRKDGVFLGSQLARLKVAQRGQGETSVGEIEPKDTKIAVLVHQDGFSVMVNQEQHPLPRKDGELDYTALAGELGRLKHSYPDKTDVQVLSADAIRFESLIKTMDAAMASGFPDISLLDAASGAP